jgi:hypothetical protein
MTKHMPRPLSSIRILALLATVVPMTAHASFLPPELLDQAAMYLAWFVVIVMPIGAIILFWLVHILPEKVAEKRQHPQKDAINTLCLLSLFFGGLLWPLAWLWAYTKPVGYRVAYGTDKHDDYFLKMAARAEAGEVDAQELRHLRDELDDMASRGPLTPELREARRRLADVVPSLPLSVAVVETPRAAEAQTARGA